MKEKHLPCMIETKSQKQMIQFLKFYHVFYIQRAIDMVFPFWHITTK